MVYVFGSKSITVVKTSACWEMLNRCVSGLICYLGGMGEGSREEGSSGMRTQTRELSVCSQLITNRQLLYLVANVGGLSIGNVAEFSFCFSMLLLRNG